MLTAEQKATVEQFMAANPFVKAELALLQRTKLQQEEIVFADKASLYRKEPSEIEEKYVHEVYNEIAKHFDILFIFLSNE